MGRTSALLAAAAFGLGALVAVVALRPGTSHAPTNATRQAAWSEEAWPFPTDPWGKGKAFVCKEADCGAEVHVYFRAKIGFCNCATGVSDDEELDRISDFDLFGNKLSPLAPGREISVAWMKGRSRPFSIGATHPARHSALSVGFNDRCDAIIATALVQGDKPAAVEPAVLEFLNSQTVVHWAEITLGL